MSRKRENLEDPVGLLRDFARAPYYEQLEREHGAPLTPEDIGVSRNLSRVTEKVLATLTPREEKILRQRFLGQKVTLEEIAKDYGVTRERIREIEANALRRVRHPSRSQRLKTFITTEEKRRDLDKRTRDRAAPSMPRPPRPMPPHKESTMTMTIDEALDIVKQNADDGAKGIKQLEEHLEEARRMAGPVVDRQLALGKRAIEAARVLIAWVEEKRLGQ